MGRRIINSVWDTEFVVFTGHLVIFCQSLDIWVRNSVETVRIKNTDFRVCSLRNMEKETICRLGGIDQLQWALENNDFKTGKEESVKGTEKQ